jgi:FixJ family two-component response regulator
MPQSVVRTEPPLVVVVDDDAAVRTALEFAIELQGFRVVTCGSAEALLKFDLPKGACCVVIDQLLPGKPGLAAIAELRRRDPKLPAVLITTHPKAQLRAAAAAAAVPILEKPLMDDALISVIRTMLAHALEPNRNGARLRGA